MMRFKKGSKVEVLTQKEVPSGSWHCAEIIGGNGRHYTVKYDGDVELLGKELVERVPRKAIRPCPPPVEVLQGWVSGDVVEVFHNFSWKMATVLKVLVHNCLLVRLLGSLIELKVDDFDVRPRLCWQDGEWILIGKASSKCGDLRFRFPSSRKDIYQSQKVDATVSRNMKGYHIGIRNDALESHVLPSITLKRKKSYGHDQAYAGPKQKIRVGKREDMKHQYNFTNQPQLPEKVDDVSPQEKLHKKCLNPSFINKVNGYSKLILERENTDGAFGCSRSISLESDDDNSVSSSVASCSVYGNHSHKLHHIFGSGSVGDNASQHSDAESFCYLRPEEGNNSFLPAKEELTQEIHRLELHAYRCTIGALHASGPLSWEQELLLTNLRHSLHISNDEHLKEIRNLGCSCGLIHLGSKCKKDDTGICHLCFGVTVPVSASISFSLKLMMLLISLLCMAGCCILPFGARWSLECLSADVKPESCVRDRRSRCFDAYKDVSTVNYGAVNLGT